MNTVKTSQTQSLPILMYHYISRYANSIAVSPEIFARHCAAMRDAGWRGIGLDEAEAYLIDGKKLPPKSCLITFDDGYLDNYVHAWPILREYGHQGVVFAVAAKIEAGDAPRPTLADVGKNSMTAADLPPVDAPFETHPDGYEIRRDLFCNWAEARQMEESGVMRMAAHSFSHQSVFTGGAFSGFLLPGKRGRTFDRTADAFWGQPRYPQGPGLANRAFLPNPDLMERIKALVPQDEREAFAFAAGPANLDALKNLVQSAGPDAGRMESDEEMAERMRTEIVLGKSILEKELGRVVTTLCWPWGAYGPLALSLGREAGFRVFITTRSGANPPASPLAVCRFKAKDKEPSWLLQRLWIYSRPLAANLYARFRL